MVLFDFHHHKKTSSGILNLELFSKLPERPFSVGIHPWGIDPNYQTQLDWIESSAHNPNCWALGECGLDGLSPVSEDLQHRAFESQIDLSNQLGMPLIIHCVRRFSMLLHFYKQARMPWIVHGFNKKPSLAYELIEKGLYLSFGKALLHNVSLQTLFSQLPSERLFLETDNATFEIEELYIKAAELKNTDLQTLSSQINFNLNSIKSHG